MITKSDLDSIYGDVGDGYFDNFYFQCNIRHIQGLLSKKSRVLELSTNVDSTKYLSKVCESVVVVDGSPKKIDRIKRLGLSNVTAICSLFEDFVPSEKFDIIILFRALEHLPHPIESLVHIRSFLSKEGKIAIAVPNGTSFHRRIGYNLKLIPSPTHLTEADIRKGHFRVYTLGTLSGVLEQAGFECIFTWGSFIKFLSDGQMRENPHIFTPQMMDALADLSLGTDPNHAAELIILAQARES